MMLPEVQLRPPYSFGLTGGSKFRKMRPADISVVARLEREAFPDPWSEDLLQHEVHANSQSRAYVLTLNERVVAYAICWSFANECHLGRIVVARRYQKRGIGGALLRNLLRQMRRQGVKDVFLEVRVSNVVARKMYLRAGFNEVAVRKNYYLKEREDAVVMCLTLREEKDELV